MDSLFSGLPNNSFLLNSRFKCFLSLNDSDCDVDDDDEKTHKVPFCDLNFCENSRFFRFMFLAIYPCILALCVSGNLLNLYIYWDFRLRTSSAVRLLASKAVCNILFVLCIGINFVREFSRDSPEFESFYWTAHPATMFIANSFGACSVW